MINDLFEAMRYPFTNKENIKNFIITSLVNIVWWLVIPWILVWGYIIKYIQNNLEESDFLPEWNFSSLKEILLKGLSVLLIFILYFAIPIILSYIGSSFMGGTIFTPEEIGSFGIPPVSLALFTISSVFFIFIMIILPMALVRYAATEELKEAFNIGEILYRIKRRFTNYFFVIFVTFLLFVTFTLMSLIPAVNLISSFFMIYLLLVSMRLYSKIYLAVEKESVEY